MTYVGQSASAAPTQPTGDETAATVKDVVAAYVGLTKPRVIELLLLTTVPVMFFAAARRPAARPGRRDRRRRHLLRRLGVGLQLRLRPRHRRADAAHPAPRAAAPHRLAARPRWSSASCSACCRRWCCCVWVNPLSAVLSRDRQRVLRLRLHDAAQAAHHPEHRLGRPGRLLPGADRLDRRHRRAVLGAGRAVRGGLLLDAAAHLGAGAALPRGLRQRRRADAARRRAGRRGRPADRALQLGDGRDLAAAVAGRRHRLVYPVAAAVLGAVFLVEAHRMWGRDQGHRGPRA